ncbi:sodium-dependent transporter [Faecalitalea cylindroides]|uniref:Transporter n=2 Tax=Faecalitalea cylindroides TaxID=39483 RepID=A0A1Y4LSW7_9FIRM|nr:sodium-dependent transporter [Faecalitalea cylindroides]CDD51119.1 transporter [Firmicutes bacterium CAG:308]MBM6652433.1 sodium-dependent transporter [Faecalitalea cylindroides]MBM6811061.1 sodium-dependent transporter [Faecalitalea cylindroides]MDB7946159.1 sodium-dependent transporter [Faecalitalea cylindroides]MDB7948175.1 sodium-dependent transporter [Faecalitalea cylindroides]
MDKKAKNSKFSSRLGYVLAVAGSAVGLGNIWRFPYLAAKYGGGIFLLVYLILTVSFGYVLIVSETALGRMTQKSPIGAFKSFGQGIWYKIGGWINAIIPILIVPYYSVIGGWVIKYFVEYIKGNVNTLAQDNYFNNFISDSFNVEFWFIIFALFAFITILGGVKNGIERSSKIMMPILVVLAIMVVIYSVTRPGAIEGVKYFLIPNFEDFSIMTIVAAMGQMFYSLSIAMGILYTYGSYLEKDVDIEKSTKQVELFDTAIAILAGLMVIPAVFAFSTEAAESLQAGPSLMFITLPKVFASMGAGTIAGILFFLLVFFAALTSAISLLETSVSSLSQQFHISRNKAIVIMAFVMLAFGTTSCLGYGVWDFISIFGMAFLDFYDFLTNSIMMPIAALATCILIIKVVGFQKIIDEVKISSPFKREKMYVFFMKYLASFFLIIILLSSVASVLGIISM